MCEPGHLRLLAHAQITLGSKATEDLMGQDQSAVCVTAVSSAWVLILHYLEMLANYLLPLKSAREGLHLLGLCFGPAAKRHHHGEWTLAAHPATLAPWRVHALAFECGALTGSRIQVPGELSCECKAEKPAGDSNHDVLHEFRF